MTSSGNKPHPVMPNACSSNWQSDVQRSGLGLIPVIFGLYGMRVGPPPSHNFVIITCNVVVSMVGVAACILMLVIQIEVGGADIEFVCMWTVIGFFGVKAPIMLVHACMLFTKLALFLGQLARTVNVIETEGRCSQKVKSSITRNIRRLTTVAVSIATVVTLAGAVSSVVYFPVKEEHIPEYFRLKVFGYSVILELMKAFLLIWFLLANSFTYVCTALLIVICKVLNKCFDCFLPENRRDTFDENFLMFGTDGRVEAPLSLESAPNQLTIGQRQMWHERLCSLVAEANHLFAPFMLLSLGGEITVLMLYSQSESVFHWLHGLVLSVVQTIMFLLTTVYCASVNEKVTSSLMLSPQHNLEEVRNFSGEHINYMLYASQLSVQGVNMTYGMFFPIRYGFIFTIAGTTLSYTLLFKDIV